MYKVMVIDDEEIIVRGLCSLVPWSKYDCVVVATASNGREALALVEEHHPDIIFSDINMPEMDGLTMVASLRSQYPAMRISILTGYPTFDYVQKATKMGVSAYMLKPSKLDQLEAALATMIQELKDIEDFQVVHDKASLESASLPNPGQQMLQEPMKIPMMSQQSSQQGHSAFSGASGSSPPVYSPALPSFPGSMDYHDSDVPPGHPEIDNDPQLPDSMISELDATHNFIIKNALAYMEENYNKKITLMDVAEHVFVSQWHLSKLIARNTNTNFSEILNGMRIKKAKELLANPGLRIWEISEMVGFGDVSHFSRIFKKNENISANEYRNSLPSSR